ncbi:MAG: 5-methyltetrahydropteroyltriglutamate--homocysteine methyltransferase, partial [Gaiellales bacterium]|nr:5-methyltetrahydropteroyltriglutamate--homocysteine methyltransferase [Gaiellales bacterium]
AEHIDLERLAISPQCGFATSVIGNAITVEDERSKLATIARAAARIWG